MRLKDSRRGMTRLMHDEGNRRTGVNPRSALVLSRVGGWRRCSFVDLEWYVGWWRTRELRLVSLNVVIGDALVLMEGHDAIALGDPGSESLF